MHMKNIQKYQDLAIDKQNQDYVLKLEDQRLKQKLRKEITN